MRLLLTAIGGPAAMCFAKSLARIEVVFVVGVDADRDAPEQDFIHAFHRVPLADDQDFIPVLNDIIRKEGIDTVIPLVDEDLMVISEHRLRIPSRILISPHETILLTNDKAKLYEKLPDFLPRRYEKVNAKFPLFVKPKVGRGGRDTHRVEDEEALEQFDAGRYVFQELLEEPEITVDALFDFKSAPLIMVPRVRVKVEQGASVVGRVVESEEVIRLVKEISGILPFSGPINFQFMRGTKGFVLTEINARSSGGMGITVNSGVDIPHMTYELLAGRTPRIPRPQEGEFRNFEEVVERQKRNVAR